MKYLCNSIDPRSADLSQVVAMLGESQLDALLRLRHWVADKIIGEPQATSYYSVEEFKRMGMVGIYMEED